MTYKIDVPPEFQLTCTYPLCDEHADLYRLPDWDCEGSTRAEILCENHAPSVGFCKGCGHYCAGLESFEFTPKVRGYCETCGESLLSEVEDEDDDDDFF